MAKKALKFSSTVQVCETLKGAGINYKEVRDMGTGKHFAVILALKHEPAANQLFKGSTVTVQVSPNAPE